MKTLSSLSCNMILLGLAVLFVSGCAQEEKQELYSDEQEKALTDKERAKRNSPSQQERDVNALEIVAIPIAVKQKNAEDGLSLTAEATLFTIALTDCDSLYSSTADESSTNLQVYKFDTGCLAKLTTFTFNGFAYTPTAADAFTTWATGDEAIFEVAADPTNTLRVRVVSTLDDPITGTEAVVYEFTEITKGSDETIADTTVGAAHNMTVSGQASPSFTIDGVTFDTMVAGVPKFTFTLECTANIDNDLCIDVDMNDIRYKLIEDLPAYSGTLTYAQAAALFPADEIAINMATEKLELGEGGTVNGGFVTQSLSGPGTIHSKPNMLLVIQADDLSYLYFNVDVEVLTQD